MKKSPDNPKSWLVAHRGDQDHGIENTFSAFMKAADSGARFAECDIQFTRDLIPVIMHDDSLKRLCNLELHASLLDLIDLKELCHTCFELLTLSRLLTWLERRPGMTLFIEIKPDVRNRISDADIAVTLCKSIPEILLPQIVLISEAGGIVDACRKLMNCRSGWVAEGSEQPESAFDYIFMPYSEAATIESWQSNGVKVGLYTVNSAEMAAELMQKGAELIETNHFSRMVSELE